MHHTAYVNAEKFYHKYCEENIQSKKILDIGACNVNGSMKPIFIKGQYVGLDIEEGPNVDVVGVSHDIPFGNDVFDIIISSSCFEHDDMFWVSFQEMCRVLKPGGYIYINAPSTGPYHAHPGDSWRFYKDSWKSLEKWGRLNKFDVELVESYIDYDTPIGLNEGVVWNDSVGIYRKNHIKKINQIYHPMENSININPNHEDSLSYQKSFPFPHTIIDNFLPDETAREILREFKSYTDWGFDGSDYSKPHQVKKFFSPWSIERGLETVPEKTKSLLVYLNSPEVLDKLEKLTGIQNLIPDLNYLGGGMHKIDSGGKLSVHSDYMLNLVTKNFRRINLLIYLNEGWEEEWGGGLQLWTDDMSEMAKEIQPIFNRAVIFSTGEKTYHGHPHPLNTPEGISRYSIALYYYTEEREGYDRDSTFTGAQWKEPNLEKMKTIVPERKKPTMCLATVCKNEEACIQRLLESVYMFIDYWVIVDTGSTDRTCEIIESFFAEKGIPGELLHEEWVSFGHNKTNMMAYAKDKSDYLIHVDADDYIVGNVNPYDFKEGYQAFFLNSLRGGTNYKAWVVLDNRVTWRFLGVAHTIIRCTEVPEFQTLDLSDKPYYAVSVLDGGARSFDPDKYFKDAQKLQKQFFDTLLDDPDGLNTRSVFYTAQSYFDCGKTEEALKWYRLYTKMMNGWEEEYFESHMRIARCMMILEWDLNKIIDQMTIAINMFPDRAEPLYHLGKHCNGLRESDLAYKYLREAREKSLEKAQQKYVLFVESYLYGNFINDELSVACYWTGRYYEGYGYLVDIIDDGKFAWERERLLENKKHFQNMMEDFKPKN